MLEQEEFPKIRARFKMNHPKKSLEQKGRRNNAHFLLMATVLAVLSSHLFFFVDDAYSKVQINKHNNHSNNTRSINKLL